MRRISVDIGGTFTDCCLVWDGRIVEAKAPTTHYNLSEGFMKAMGNAAEQLGVTVREIMSTVDSVRYGTTLGTNALLERSGPSLGLITTSGFEDVVILGRGRQYGEGLTDHKKADIPGADRPSPIIPRSSIVGVHERIDYRGDVVYDISRDEIREKVQTLVDKGVRGFVVCFINAVMNPVHEKIVEEVIQEEYPTNFLGSFPVILSHTISGKKGEYTRTISSILDAYLHREMQYGLRSLEIELRKNGYSRPMIVVHNTGGMAQLKTTHALQTIHAGPVAGLFAAEQLAKETDNRNLITTDMGGTSFDIGLVVGGGVRFYEFNPVIDRWLVSIPMIDIKAIGAGGGSIATFDETFRSIEVGPQSAGSDPGPACFDMGGAEPTVTDADLILGYLNPDNYAGGKIRLNRRRAEQAIKRKIADPMGITVLEAVAAIRKIVDAKMSQAIFKEIALKGYDPRKFALLAYGGNGATHCCGYAEGLGVTRIIVPPNASIFSAVGGGNMDQVHIHEKSAYLYLYNPGQKAIYDRLEEFNAIAGELAQKGRDDLLRQGFDVRQIRHRLEMDMRYGDQLQLTSVVSPVETLKSRRDVLEIIKSFHLEYGKRFGKGSQTPEVGIKVNVIRLVSYVNLPRLPLAGNGNGRGKPVAATALARRDCHFESVKGVVSTPIYLEKDLPPSTVVAGPAIVEGVHTTFVVYPGWAMEVGDRHLVTLNRCA